MTEAIDSCELLITVDRVHRITKKCIVLHPRRPQLELNLIKSCTQRLNVVITAKMIYGLNKPNLTQSEICMLKSFISLMPYSVHGYIILWLL